MRFAPTRKSMPLNQDELPFASLSPYCVDIQGVFETEPTPSKLKILFISPEVAPYVKVGGLADVVGSLPKALEALGHDVRIVCPSYGSIKKDGAWRPRGKPLGVPMGHGMRYARVWETTLGDSNVTCYFIEYDEYYARPEVYEGAWGWNSDNDKRFGFLTRAALEIPFWAEWMPDIIHAHDWATALAPVMTNTVYAGSPLGQAATILTIHNLQHQGYCDRSIIDYLGLPHWLYDQHQLEAMGAVSMLKGGIYHATKITTVSPTYAKEILTPAGGHGMHEILRSRSSDLLGILNGIDTSVWTPRTDPFLPTSFTATDIGNKEECKQALCTRFGLDYSPTRPVCGVVSRLYEQKGLDLLAKAAPRILESTGMQFAVLGTGDSELERLFCRLNARYPGSFATWVGFDDPRAHLIYGGSDFFLMPSRFEPCGLGQLYAMAYGTVPIVRATGGLADTVHHYQRPDGTGILFEDLTEAALVNALDQASQLFAEHLEQLKALRERCMQQDFSWEASAQAYSIAYAQAIRARLGASACTAEAFAPRN